MVSAALPDLRRRVIYHMTWRRRTDAGVQHFVDNDAGYLDWLAGHPGGFVINTSRRPSAAYLMLHRANCWTITRLQPKATTFTGDYTKLCGGRVDLEAHARRLGGTAQACGHLSVIPTGEDPSSFAAPSGVCGRCVAVRSAAPCRDPKP